MIEWKFKGRNFYFNYLKALGILGLLVFAPLVFIWSENIYINWFSIPSLITYLLIIYIVYKSCVDSYEPYYFDENGKLIEGEEPEDLKAKRLKANKDN
ncbi:hypothetical protein EHF38_04995 [Acinetobacter baumannii]|uniref:hypothetical protein n=1 Tax=Acinetobacter calcoaceticus/baumannii complex TaxID=909768 RepID=UPI000FEC989C|nr:MULTISPECIES: hypothetical protein [Acinetobacter calcoaceticus/baumannii complex]MBR7715597.1 hypothetical protein [Acinetobacter nosocomialis]MDC4143917.1 hypothetical protein [Acinetobacter nosocomialis]QAB39722.1 hypothetical protein EHF38_04995 [Acinetobacter baumannii]